MKICGKCKIEKTEESFYKDKKGKNGLNATCKECAIAHSKKWKSKNPENVKNSIKKRRKERHSELLEKEAEYREVNREKINEAGKKYREANRDLCRKRGLEHYYKNREKYREYADANHEKRVIYDARYRKLHADKIRIKKREFEFEYRKTKPLQHKARKAVYHAIKRGDLTRSKKCQMCNTEGNVEAHHSDYTEMLSVIWVCRKCHGGIHRTLNRT